MMQIKTLPLLLREQSQNRPEKLAILGTNRKPLSYSELMAHAETVVAELNKLGIGRHDRVAIVLPNGPEMAVAFLAVASCATSAPLNPSYQAAEFEFYLTDLQARALIVAAGLDSPARDVARQHNIPIIELLPDGEVAGTFALRGDPAGAPVHSGYAEADDVALVLHTSGTTSRPKIVPLTHRNILTSAHNIRTTLQLTEADRCLNVMVLFHIHGLMAALMASLAAGGSVVCTPGFLAPRFFEWLADFRPTWYTAVPTIHQAVLARAAENRAVTDEVQLRFVRSSSSSLAPSVMAELEETFHAPVIEAYGMTEASHQMTSNPLPPAERKPGTVGRPAGPQVAIMHESENMLLPPGERGEIVIRGANVTEGYASNPEANAKAFTDGWFRTGDQGFFDGDGYLTISGRLKEIINRGGEKILPREIDEVLLEHPAVAQAVAFGIPNPVLGEEVGAAVVLCEEGVSAGELRRFVADRLAFFKVPHQLLIVDAIPKGATGKLQRIGLAEKLGVRAQEAIATPEPTAAPDEFVEPQNEIERRLAGIWSDVLRLPRVSVTQRFLDSGGDSMTAAQLISTIQQQFDLRLSVVDLFDAPTIREQAIVVRTLSKFQSPPMQEFAPMRRIQAGNAARPPLFLVPGGGGGEEEFLAYARLIHLLGTEQTVHGFFARGLDGQTRPHGSVADMVDDYVRELRATQPRGPYWLSGECVGGKAAYEMACRLDAAGETVHLLLLNTQFRQFAPGRSPGGASGGYWLGRARYHWTQLQKRRGGERMRYLLETLQASPLNPAVVLGEGFRTERQILRVRVGYNEMLQQHVPSTPYHQPITLIVSDDFHAQTPTMGIERWARGGLTVHAVPGDFESYLGAHVETTARRVRSCLAATREPQPQSDGAAP